MNFAKSLVFLCAVFYSANGNLLDTVVGGATGLVSDAVQVATNDYAKTNFILFTAERNASVPIANASTIISDASFNAALPTVLYIHGYQENPDSNSVGVVSRAFIKKGSHNFILVDWSAYAGPPYAVPVLALPTIGEVVGNAVDRIVQAGLSRDGLWLIGHSLGGQMSALISKALDFQPKRITALDPALPGFNVPGFPNLTRDDAVMVDVIHTDAGVFGFNEPCGHVDFWPNGGHALQPGCLEVLPTSLTDVLYCSHRRSWAYFAESVNDEEAFPGVLCDSESDFNAGDCPANATNVVFLGYKRPANDVVGDFYLRTNAEEPYARLQSGLLPSEANAASETSQESSQSLLPEAQSANKQDDAQALDNITAGSTKVVAALEDRPTVTGAITNFFGNVLETTQDFFESLVPRRT